jgi:chromosome partitioning protein
MPAPVVAVLNMKGGVGKTTISAHMMRELYMAKKNRVLLVDLDPQYNLTQQLLEPTSYDEAVAEGRISLRTFEPAPVSDFFDVNTSGDDPPSPKEISIMLRHFKNSTSNISIVPGTFELTKYSFISDQAKLGHAREYFKRAISKARAEFDLVVLDMNPSSSFLTFCGLSVATDILSPVRPDKFSVLGLELVKKLIDHPAVGGKPSLHIVMNGVKKSEGITQTEKDIRSAPFFKDRLLANRVYQSGARHLLLGSKVALLEAGTGWAIGSNRGAASSLRAYVENAFAWLYYKDHPVEFRAVEARRADLKLPKAVQLYIKEMDGGFERAYLELIKHSDRGKDDEYYYSVVSQFVHAHPGFATFSDKIHELAVSSPRDESFLKLCKKSDEFISDNYAAYYRASWDDAPAAVKLNLTERLKAKTKDFLAVS